MKKNITIFLASFFVIMLAASFALANYGDDNKLSGHVRAYNTLNPLNKAKVKLYSSGGHLKKSKKTTGNGSYKFSDLTEGTYKVKASLAGYRNPKDANKSTVSKTVKVDGSEKKNLYLQKI